jgi:hypothetical protein
MPAAVSVIIPVLHEAREVGALLPHWRELRRGCQCMQAADWAGAIRADQIRALPARMWSWLRPS